MLRGRDAAVEGRDRLYESMFSVSLVGEVRANDGCVPRREVEDNPRRDVGGGARSLHESSEVPVHDNSIAAPGRLPIDYKVLETGSIAGVIFASTGLL